MLIQKSHLTLASAAALFAFANVAMTTSAYAADPGTQAVSHCYGVLRFTSTWTKWLS